MRILQRYPAVGIVCSVGTVVSAVLASGGCSGDGGSAGAGSGSRQTSSLGSVFASRPRVSMSVAEAYPGSAVEQLNFFDAIEKRDLVSHDDALHASLLLFTGQSAATYAQRAARAKQIGLVPAKFDRPAREAVTVGELSQIIAAGMGLASNGSEGQSLAALKEAGVLPSFVKENAGVSGAQLLTTLGRAEDAIALRGTAPAATNEHAARPLTDEEKVWTAAAVFAPVQPATGQPPSRPPTKKPPIDLEEEAKKPRPGQVLPEGTAPSPESPSPAPAPTPTTARPTPPAPTAPPPEGRAPAALPPPRAEGAAPSRMDGVASDLRYVAVDRVAAEATEVLGPGELAQWRAVDDGRGRPGEWQTLQPGAAINERIEIRTGLGTRATLRVGDGAVVVIHRLSRVRIERKIRSDGESQLGVTVYRGMIDATGFPSDDAAVSTTAILVRTPDQVFPLRARALFEYDAFEGTKAREFRPPN